jgi:hypothetical protein
MDSLVQGIQESRCAIRLVLSARFLAAAGPGALGWVCAIESRIRRLGCAVPEWKRHIDSSGESATAGWCKIRRLLDSGWEEIGRSQRGWPCSRLDGAIRHQPNGHDCGTETQKLSKASQVNALRLACQDAAIRSQYSSISSRGLFLVSGTKNQVNTACASASVARKPNVMALPA